MATKASSSVGKSLELLRLVVASGGEEPLQSLADRLGLPLSTAHRLFAELEAAGFLARERRGLFHPGPALLAMAQTIDLNQVMARISRPHLKALARTLRNTVHLGVLENQMVTYLVKQPYGRRELFTREGMQLEAYCSGLGKVLLANTDPEYLHAYLSEGPFIRLTPRTKVDPAVLRHELTAVAALGYGVDDGEVTEGLTCVAAPVHGAGRRVCAAISVSAPSAGRGALEVERAHAALQACARDIGQALDWR